MKPVSEEASRVLVIQVQIQAVSDEFALPEHISQVFI